MTPRLAEYSGDRLRMTSMSISVGSLKMRHAGLGVGVVAGVSAEGSIVAVEPDALAGGSDIVFGVGLLECLKPVMLRIFATLIHVWD